jgi:hypothetical protein
MVTLRVQDVEYLQRSITGRARNTARFTSSACILLQVSPIHLKPASGEYAKPWVCNLGPRSPSIGSKYVLSAAAVAGLPTKKRPRLRSLSTINPYAGAMPLSLLEPHILKQGVSYRRRAVQSAISNISAHGSVHTPPRICFCDGPRHPL